RARRPSVWRSESSVHVHVPAPVHEPWAKARSRERGRERGRGRVGSAPRDPGSWIKSATAVCLALRVLRPRPRSRSRPRTVGEGAEPGAWTGTWTWTGWISSTRSWLVDQERDGRLSGAPSPPSTSTFPLPSTNRGRRRGAGSVDGNVDVDGLDQLHAILARGSRARRPSVWRSESSVHVHVPAPVHEPW